MPRPSTPEFRPLGELGGAGRNVARSPRSTHGNGRHAPGVSPDESTRRLTQALGWFGVGLGLAALVAPQRLAHAIGMGHNGGSTTLLRVVGLRELASGIGLLTQQDPSHWLWARVGGDAMDLAILTKAMGKEEADRGRVAATTAAIIGVTAVDAFATRQVALEPEGASQETHRPAYREPRIASAITVNAPIAEVFAAWDGFEGLPRFMDSFATVRVTDERLSHWQMALPGGMTVAWDAVITDVLPNERITWLTGDTSNVRGSGEVRFRPAPGNQGTEIRFEARFDPPGGELGSKLARLFTDPLGVKLNNDLRRCKQLIELGEIVASDDSVVKGPNPAQPIDQNAA